MNRFIAVSFVSLFIFLNMTEVGLAETKSKLGQKPLPNKVLKVGPVKFTRQECAGLGGVENAWWGECKLDCAITDSHGVVSHVCIDGKVN